MVEGTEASTQNQDIKTSSNEAVQSAVPANTVSSVETQAEKTLRQSEVNKIVGAVKHEAYEKGKKDALTESQSSATNQNFNATNNNVGQSQNAISDDKIRELIVQESTNMANQQIAQRIAGEFIGKLEAGKSKYPDLDKTVAKLNLVAAPLVVHWANSLPNTADVINELGQNPTKYANVLYLAEKFPQLATDELKKLSDSIQLNEEAAKQKLANEPLSQVNPSTTGRDTGHMTISELRKQKLYKV